MLLTLHCLTPGQLLLAMEWHKLLLPPNKQCREFLVLQGMQVGEIPGSTHVPHTPSHASAELRGVCESAELCQEHVVA